MSQTETQAQAAEQQIADTWEKSPKYKEYLIAMEAGDLKTAMEIKKATVNEITKVVLKDYIADFKDEYEGKYLQKFYNFPMGLSELASDIHKSGKLLLKDKSEKGRHDFVKAVYDFMNHYNKEDGKAEKYAQRLMKKAPGIEGTKFMDILLEMGKQSDIEAAKSPEQKAKEQAERLRNKQQQIDSNKQQIDSNKQQIDSNKQQIEKWNQIIKQLKSL